MPTIREIREKVQAPRREVDAAYGLFMRRFSAYLTWVCFHLKLSPNQVTFISLLVMLIGSFLALKNSSILTWIVAVNLWYVIDHVDGELARLKNLKSDTGYYFDTALNFIVQLLFFVVLEILLKTFGFAAQNWGWFAAYNVSMLSILPMIQDVIQSKSASQSLDRASSTVTKKTNVLKIIFVLMHKIVLFPNILIAATVLCLVAIFNFDLAILGLFYALVIWSLLSFVVWVVQLSHTVISKKLG